MPDQQLIFEVLAKMRDEASVPLEKLKTGFEGLKGAMVGTSAAAALATGDVVALGAAHEQAGGSVTHFTRAARELAGGLSSSLSPALGTVVSQMISVTTGAGQLAGGIGVVVGAIAIGTVAFSTFAAAQREATTRAVELNYALSALDTAGVKSQLEGATKALQQYDAGLMGTIATMLRTQGAFNALDIILGRPAKEAGITGAQAALEKLYPLELAKQWATAESNIAKAMEQVTAQQAGRAQQLDDVARFVALNKELVGYINEQVAAQAKLIELETRTKLAAATAAGQPETSLNLIRAEGRDALRALNIRAQGQRAQAVTSREAGVQGILDRTAQPTESGQGFEAMLAGVSPQDLAAGMARVDKEAIEKLRAELASALAQIEGQGFEQTGVGPTTAETVKGLSRAAGADAQQLDLQKQALEIRRSALGLSADERDQLTLQTVELERQREIKLANGDQDRIDLANLRAAVESGNTVRQQLERNDPMEGFRAGLRKTADDMADWGKNMAAMMQSIATSMSDALTTGFFDVMTGNFKDLANVGQQFGQALLKNILQAFSQQAVGQIMQALRGALGGVLPGSASGQGGFLLPGMLNPSGGPIPSGAPTLLMAGDANSAVVIGASGVPIPYSDVKRAYDLGGQPAVNAVVRGDASVENGNLVFGSGETALGGQAAIDAINARQSGFTGSNVLGGATSLAALGIVTYGATQNKAGTAGIVTSAVGGAFAGAALGASVASILGSSSGYGTAIGAVVGALAAGGAAAYGKNQTAKQAAAQRQLDEVTRASGAATAMVQAAGAAKTLQEFVDALAVYQSGSVGGTSSVATPAGIDNVPITNLAPPGVPSIDAAELTRRFAENPDTQIGVNIQAGVDPAQLAGPNAAASAALTQIAKGLTGQFNTAAQGVGVSAEDQVGGVSRTTTVPATLAGRLGNTDLQVDKVAFSQLSPDDAELLLRLLRQTDIDRGLGIFLKDPATGQVLSVTQLAVPQTMTPVTGAGIAPPPVALPSGLPAFPSTPVFGPNDTADQQSLELAQYLGAFAPFAQALTPAQRSALASLTPDQVDQLIRSGSLTTQQVAGLTAAGLLPLVAARAAAQLAAADAAATGQGAGASDGTALADSPAVMAGLTGVSLATAFGGTPASDPAGPTFGTGLSGTLAGNFGAPGSPGPAGGPPAPGVGSFAAGFFTGTPAGLAGQAVAAALNALSASQGVSNFAGTIANTIVGLALSPVFGMLNTLLGIANVAGQTAIGFATTPSSTFAFAGNPGAHSVGFGEESGPNVSVDPTDSIDISDPAMAASLGFLGFQGMVNPASFNNPAEFGTPGASPLGGIVAQPGLSFGMGGWSFTDPTTGLTTAVGAGTGNSVPGSTNFSSLTADTPSRSGYEGEVGPPAPSPTTSDEGMSNSGDAGGGAAGAK